MADFGSGDLLISRVYELATGDGHKVILRGNDGANFQDVLVNSSGRLQVDIVGGGGTGGTSATDDATFAAGAGSGTPAMGFFSADTVDAGDVGVFAMDASRRILTSLEVDNVGLVTESGGNLDSLKTNSDLISQDVSGIAPDTTAIAAAVKDEAGAVTSGILIQGDDGTDRKNINVDATTGDVQVDVTNTVTVDWAGTAPPIGAGVEATALRVTVATDSTGVVSVDDNGASLSIDDGGNTITVDGAVTTSGTVTEASASAIKNAVEVMDDWDETNRAAVNTISGQVGVQGASGVDTALTQRVSLATDIALPTGSNQIGKLAANSGIDIGDVDVLSLPAITATEYTFGADATPIDNLYNAAAESKTSDAKDAAAYRMATFSTKLVYAGAASTAYIVIEVWVSGASTNYMKLMNGPVGSWVYDDVAIGGGLEVALTFPVCGSNVKIKMVSTNCDATHTITSSNSSLYLRE